jgi:hypothetical protein
MSVQTNFVADSIDRVQEAIQSVGDEFERLQDQFDGQRKKFGRQTEKRVRKLQKDLRKQPLWKRADTLRRDATKQIEQGVDGLLGTLQIASSSDMKKLDRKLSALGKRIKQIEGRAKANGANPESL